jgi:alpha-D-xyloside xylohydrolase
MLFILPSLRLAGVATCSLAIASLGAESPVVTGAAWVKPVVEQVALGVWKVRFGTPERFTPGAIRETGPRTDDLKQLPAPTALPFELGQIRCRITPSHTAVYVPCDEPEEQIYGFGLDPGAYEQKGLRKYLTVCAGVIGKSGASHGPVPFYVSTRGYGVYVDTARVPLVHVARLTAKDQNQSGDGHPPTVETSARELDVVGPTGGRMEVVFELQGNSRGVEVYVFGGPTLREAVQRYNLFSGGGAVPPMWGLGLKYRTFTGANQASVLQVARSLRAMRIPCDMIGLEPGWQSHAYSCSLVWSKERFPQHEAMVRDLGQSGFKINLWAHAYIHPTSPLYMPLRPHSGDYLFWGGLVVDFADPEAFRIFADYHDREFVSQGILGFKADECDNQPIDDPTPFNYPYCSVFASGIDGDQMTQLFGYYQQRALLSAFRAHNHRTWGDVRATTALASPLPFNLYSDAYTFEQYLRQLVNASFTGLLWSPEVREARNLDELLNRVAMSAFAPQMCLDLWFMPHPPWEQYDGEKNKAHQLLPEAERQEVANRLRSIVNQRYELLPYLYACFHRYRTEGLPPVRSLLLDFPQDRTLRAVDNAIATKLRCPAGSGGFLK